MASRAAALPFGIRIESGISTPSPAKTRQSQTHVDSQGIELPEIKSSSQDETVTTPRETLTTESPITGEPSSELEQRKPPPPGAQQNVVTIQPSFSYPRMNKFRVLAACMTYFGNGVNDSAPGALIPYLESWYDIGYATVSLIFVTNAVGFIVSAFSNDAIPARLGRAGALVLSEAFMIAGYVVITCSPPFPAVVAAYLLLGFGNGLNLALNNVFCANLANSTVILGIASGSYGIGGILGPIIATALVSAGAHWSRFYIIAIAIRSTCLLLAAWSYRSYEKEPTSRINSSQPTTTSSSDDSKSHLLLHTLKNKTTLIGALLIFAYQGAEVSESGWFISYLIDSRGADPKRVGYVTSGFWAGITVGRFVLTHATPYFGEKKFVFILGLGTVGFQIMAWFLPNVIGDSVAVAIIGLLLGPIYPCCTAVFSRLLPLNLQVSAIGFISSAGSSGGAVVPLITGLLAQAAGTWVLHPVCIVFYVVMLIAWALLPKVVKRDE